MFGSTIEVDLAFESELPFFPELRSRFRSCFGFWIRLFFESSRSCFEFGSGSVAGSGFEPGYVSLDLDLDLTAGPRYSGFESGFESGLLDLVLDLDLILNLDLTAGPRNLAGSDDGAFWDTLIQGGFHILGFCCLAIRVLEFGVLLVAVCGWAGYTS